MSEAEKLGALMARLEDVLGEDFHHLEKHEVEGVREILKWKDTLIRIAEYEQARGLVWQKNKSALLGAGAIVGVLTVLGTNAKTIVQWLAAP